MSQYVRFSLTGVLYFPYASPATLSNNGSKFKKLLEKALSSRHIYSDECSINLSRVYKLGFVIRANDEQRSSLSYQLSIMAHVDAYTHEELDGIFHAALREVLTKCQAGLVIFSSIAEEKDSRHASFRLGSTYHFSKKAGLNYLPASDYRSEG